MTNKLWYLTKMSLKKKMGSKWFLVANLLLCIAIVGLFNMDSIINAFGGDFTSKTEIIVIDETKKFYPILDAEYKRNQAILGDMVASSIVLTDKSLEDAKKEVETGKLLVVITKDEKNYINAKLISKTEMDALVLQTLTTSINNAKTSYALALSDIDVGQLTGIYQPVTIEKEYLEDVKNLDETMGLVMGTVFPIVILPFFMLTIFLVQMIGAEVNEEKTTRGMEIIISNVSPKTHFYSKVLSGNVFVLTQGALLVLFAIIAGLVRVFTTGVLIPGAAAGDIGAFLGDVVGQLQQTGILSILAYAIPLMLILMVVNFILYSLLAGVLASMTTNMEDFQQLQTPIIIICMAGYYLSIMAAMFDGSVFIRAISYIPFISPLVAPALLVLGQTTIWDMIISIAISIGTVFVLTKYGLRIYKVGILNYSSSKLWKKMFKAVKTERV